MPISVSIASAAKRSSIAGNQKRKSITAQTADNEMNREIVSVVRLFRPINFQPEMFEYNLSTLRDNNCLSKFMVFNDGSIKCKIYVKKSDSALPSLLNSDAKKASMKNSFLSKLFIPKTITEEQEKHQLNAIEVSLAWSIDSWKTWKAIKARYIEQTYQFLIYEAVLFNANNIVQFGKTIEFVSCYINDDHMHRDTNNKKSYTFERIEEKIIVFH